MTHNCHGIGPKSLAGSRKKESAAPCRSLIGGGLGRHALEIDTAMSSPENIHAEDMPFETNGVDIRVGRQMWSPPVEYDGRSQDDVTFARKGGFQLLAVLP